MTHLLNPSIEEGQLRAALYLINKAKSINELFSIDARVQQINLVDPNGLYEAAMDQALKKFSTF